MIETNGMDHVVLFVKDLDRALQFYGDILGMPVDPSHYGAFVKVGLGQRIGLFVKDRMEGWPEHPNPHDGKEIVGGSEINHLSLTTEKGTYESVKTELETNGVKVSSRPNDPEGLYFEDPEGHKLRLYVGHVPYPPPAATIG